jgi:hypothetical protein
MSGRWIAYLVVVTAAALLPGPATAQTTNPAPGYFDIPAGFDFPADKAVLQQYTTTGNLAAERLHVWNVFAGMTQRTPDGKYAIFETWYDETETFDPNTGAISALALKPRQVSPRFHVPTQFQSAPNAALAVGGEGVLSFVLYNFAAFNHIRSKGLYQKSTLNTLRSSGTPNPTFPQDRDVPAFPASAVALKLVWWPIAKDKATAMPIWDPDQNPPQRSGNPLNTWVRYVGVDPTKTNLPPDQMADILYNGQTKHVHVVGADRIYLFPMTADQAQGINADGVLRQMAQAALGRPVQAGDFAALVATHLTTKEIDNWVWATFWWHD